MEAQIVCTITSCLKVQEIYKNISKQAWQGMAVLQTMWWSMKSSLNFDGSLSSRKLRMEQMGEVF